MAIYGVDQYGKALYGADLGIDYTVTNLAAVQSDFGRITISWDSPRQNNWTQLTLVRSGYGFPVAITDGVQLASWPNTGARTSYSDVALPAGYWYYTVFATVPLTTWSPTLTYQNGDRVSYASANWICIASYSLNVTPGTDSTVWIASDETQLWHPAGSVACLAVADHGYGALLESLIPAPYKVTPGSSTDPGAANPDLIAFLGVLGFGFSQMQAELDDLLDAYDVLTTRQDRLAAISATLGLSQELASSVRFQRLRTLQAAHINQERGTARGITDSIFAATGLTSQIATAPNLMLSQDQAAFADPIPPPWNPSATYTIGQEVLYLGVRYQCTGFIYQVTPATYASQSVIGSPNALATTTIGSTTYVKESAAAAGSVTVPFTIPANGTYYIYINAAIGPDYGVLSATIDGATAKLDHYSSVRPLYGGGGGGASSNSLDMYAATAAAYNIFLGPLTLAPGNHTLVLNTLTKNGASSGYSIAFSLISVQGNPAVFPPGNPPSGATLSSTQWSTTATATFTGYANPVTGALGSWSPLTTTTLVFSVNYFGG